MKHMKSVSLRHMQHHLSDVMRHVDQGQEVLVTRRRRTDILSKPFHHGFLGCHG
jgi:hypothetical protein